VSKFFKALEKLEQERADEARSETAAAPDATATAIAEAPAAPDIPPPPSSEPVPPAPVALDEPPAVRAAVAEAPRRPEHRPVYGAPVARDTAGLGFAWQMAPEAASEPGELDDHLVSLLEPTSFAAEQYRAVRLAIETFRRERGTRLVAISSPSRRDGKTITAINLAGALAQSPDARVVLVDVDLRHPGIARYLGIPEAPGLSTYLLDQSLAVDTLIARPRSTAFAVVPAGPVSSMPYELLKSPRLTALFAALRERFDYVVVDTPPVLPFPDVGILRDAVDGFVLVVRANRTPREMLRDSMNSIGRQRALGVVWNDDDRTAVGTYADRADEAGWRRYLPGGASRVA
jgi:capsular exopolysaccharide synthesis family protein